MPCGRALWARIVLASSQSRHVSLSPHSPACARAVCVGCRIGRRVTDTSEQCEECKCPASAATSTSSRACNICLFVFVCSTQLSGEKKMPPEYHRVMQCRTPYFVRVCLRAQPTFEPADPPPPQRPGVRTQAAGGIVLLRPSSLACRVLPVDWCLWVRLLALCRFCRHTPFSTMVRRYVAAPPLDVTSVKARHWAVAIRLLQPPGADHVLVGEPARHHRLQRRLREACARTRT